MMRIGHGFDVHAFGGEGPLIIGGVRIPYDRGLLAHSDGDVALHALTDALLGAAASGALEELRNTAVPAQMAAILERTLRTLLLRRAPAPAWFADIADNWLTAASTFGLSPTMSTLIAVARSKAESGGVKTWTPGFAAESVFA